MVKDYYEILGVVPQATLQEIKIAYRKLAKQFHPDIVGDDAVKRAWFDEIKTAYTVLTDTTARYRYHEQRWLWKSEGMPLKETRMITATAILKDMIALEKQVHFLDANRNNSFFIANSISEILNNRNLQILEQNKDSTINKNIVDYLMQLALLVPLNFFEILKQKISVIPLSESKKKEVLLLLDKIAFKKKGNDWIEKNKWIAVLLLTALFLWVIKIMVK